MQKNDNKKLNCSNGTDNFIKELNEGHLAVYNRLLRGTKQNVHFKVSEYFGISPGDVKKFSSNLFRIPERKFNRNKILIGIIEFTLSEALHQKEELSEKIPICQKNVDNYYKLLKKQQNGKV